MQMYIEQFSLFINLPQLYILWMFLMSVSVKTEDDPKALVGTDVT